MEQLPSGGCVLKHCRINRTPWRAVAATFGWLCVETRWPPLARKLSQQLPSGGCVLKHRQATPPKIKAGNY